MVNHNHAVDINPPSAAIHINARGSDWLWSAFSIFGLATLVFFAWAFAKPATHRVLFYIPALVTLIASINYFTLASDLGSVGVPVQFHHKSGDTRQIFWTRYMDWFVTSALMLLGLFLTTGMPWQHILFIIVMVWTSVVCGLAGAFTATSYKWGYFTFGVVLMFFIFYSILIPGRRHANVLGAEISRVYNMTGLWAVAIAFLYPICWGVSEGGNVITSDGEAVFYGILDLFAKIGYGVIFNMGHHYIDPARVGLRVRDYDDEIPGARHAEKRHAGVGASV